MGTYADRMAALRLRVLSPDGRILLTLPAAGRLTVNFRDGAFRGYDAAELRRQLRAALTRLAEAHRRARLDALSQALGRRVDSEDGDGPFDTGELEFHRRREQLTVRGASKRRLVGVKHSGATGWDVRIEPRALTELDAEQFGAELAEAHTALLANRIHQLMPLRAELFGSPAHRRGHRRGTAH